MKITRIRISNYRGIEAFDEPISAGGVVAKGKNGTGKSTVLHAIQAALAARDIKGDAVRLGADRAEILIDLDAVEAASITRTIPRDGQAKLVVKGADGVPRKRPTELLQELLGTVALDPLELMSLDPKARRARVLAAMPITVTADELRAWAPSLPGAFAVGAGEHGLEAVERARAAVYEARAVANKEAERTAAEARVRAAEAQAKEVADPFLSLDAAELVLQQARARYADAAAREKAAAQHNDRTARARGNVAELRDKADAADVSADAIAEVDRVLGNARADREAQDNEVRRLEALLARVRQQRDDSDRLIAKQEHVARDLAASLASAERMRAEAARLEETIDAGAPDAPTADEITEVLAAVSAAEQGVRDAAAAEHARALSLIAQQARERAEAAALDARALDEQVKRLANDAPKALLSRADGIDGLEILGDDVALDGVRSSALCGMEETWFCVQIAMRAARGAKILVCDGLERLDDEQWEAFVVYVHAAGFQLIASRVTGEGDGGVVLEAIAP